MIKDLPFRCACGQVTGMLTDVTPETSNHVACCCRGCQTYARALGREDILDETGATTVFQLSPRQLRIETGHEHIKCLQQVPRKGAFRWYAGCCRSPIANTLPTGSMPFLGVLAVAVDQDALDAPLESYIGPLKVTVNGSFSKAEAKARRATTWDLLKMLAGYAPRFFGWWWRGDQKHSVFFEGKTPIRPVEHTLPQANSGKMLS